MQETRFRMEELPKITKIRSADKYKQILNSSVEMKPESMKNQFRNPQQKKMLKNSAPTIKKYFKHDFKMGPKSENILGEMPLGALLVAQTAFVIKK